MKMQNQSFHKEVDNKYNNDLDYISENCNYCGLELIRVEDILVDEDNNYCCHDCNLYHKLNAKEIKEI